MKLFKKLLVDSAKRVENSKLAAETWGNLSVRDPKSGYIFLTPGGIKHCDITEDDIVVCDAFGRIIEGKRKPTVEMLMHITIYQNRPEINAVIHTHPVYSLVYAAQGKDIPLILDEAAQTLGERVKCAEYALPGSPALAKNCIEALGTKAKACLLKCHGAVCIGEDMYEAFTVVEVLETTARVLCLIECSGGKALTCSQDNFDKLSSMLRDYKQN